MKSSDVSKTPKNNKFNKVSFPSRSVSWKEIALEISYLKLAKFLF